MNLLTILLGMTYSLANGAQPDWSDFAKDIVPSSRMEIIYALNEKDSWRMQGDSSKVLYNLKPKEKYAYTNNYEFSLALNRHLGYEEYITFNRDMIDSLLPIVRLKIDLDSLNNDVIYMTEPDFPAFLWHPEGIYFDWRTKYNILGTGYRIDNRETIKFINHFFDQPYIFTISISPKQSFQSFEYIGVLRDNKLVITDHKGNKYDGLEELIIKLYGSVDNYVKEYKRIMGSIN